MKLKDNVYFGAGLALVVPLIVFFGIYLGRFSAYPLPEFWQVFGQESRMITFFAVWCLVANIGLFTLFVNTRKDRSARGTFVVTLLYGAAFLLLRWMV